MLLYHDCISLVEYTLSTACEPTCYNLCVYACICYRPFLEGPITSELISPLDPSQGCVRENHDVFFVLDGSGSISLSYFERMKYFLIKLIEQLDVGPEGTHVGLLQFSHSIKTKIEFNLGEHKTFEKIKEAIAKMSYQEGGTDTGNALEIVNTKVSPLSNRIW